MSTILSIISLVMPIILWIFDKFRVSKANQEAFIAKVQSAKDDGSVGIEQRDEFKKQDEELRNDSKRSD